MSPEQKFSNWLCKTLRDNGAFVQKLEVTTGRGVPDLVVMNQGTTFIELKFNTTLIRPEQLVWAMNAQKPLDTEDHIVIALCGFEDRMELYTLENIKPLKKSYKLTEKVATYPKNLEGVRSLMNYL